MTHFVATDFNPLKKGFHTVVNYKNGIVWLKQKGSYNAQDSREG